MSNTSSDRALTIVEKHQHFVALPMFEQLVGYAYKASGLSDCRPLATRARVPAWLVRAPREPSILHRLSGRHGRIAPWHARCWRSAFFASSRSSSPSKTQSAPRQAGGGLHEDECSGTKHTAGCRRKSLLSALARTWARFPSSRERVPDHARHRSFRRSAILWARRRAASEATEVASLSGRVPWRSDNVVSTMCEALMHHDGLPRAVQEHAAECGTPGCHSMQEIALL